MRANCESRIRGYTREVNCRYSFSSKTPRPLLTPIFLCVQLLQASKDIVKSKVRTEFLKASEALVKMLKEANYNGRYFDRTTDEAHRLCTREGWFTCQVSQEGLSDGRRVFLNHSLPVSQISISVRICFPIRVRLIRIRACLSTPLIPTAAKRAGLSSAPGIWTTGTSKPSFTPWFKLVTAEPALEYRTLCFFGSSCSNGDQGTDGLLLRA